MSVNPSAPLGEPQKCRTCGDDENKNPNVQLAANKDYLTSDGGVINIDTLKNGNEIITIYRPDGTESSTWHVGPDGHQLPTSPGG